MTEPDSGRIVVSGGLAAPAHLLAGLLPGRPIRDALPDINPGPEKRAARAQDLTAWLMAETAWLASPVGLLWQKAREIYLLREAERRAYIEAVAARYGFWVQLVAPSEQDTYDACMECGR